MTTDRNGSKSSAPPEVDEYSQTSKHQFAMVDAEWLKLPLTPTELKVLIALLAHANRKPGGYGGCWPKVATIAAVCGVSTSHVSKALRTLEAMALITTLKFPQKNRYFVKRPGQVLPMPPSYIRPFLRHLKQRGVEFVFDAGAREPRLAAWSKPMPSGLLGRIWNEYVEHMPPARLARAILSVSDPDVLSIPSPVISESGIPGVPNSVMLKSGPRSDQ